jgi:hypothetical protein
MQYQDIHKHLESLDKCRQLPGGKFAYAAVKTFNAMVSATKAAQAKRAEIIKKWKSEHKDHAEYEKQRIDLCIVHSERDEEGKPIITNNQYQLVDVESFNKELEDINKKFPKYMLSLKKADELIEELYNTPAEVNIHTIPREDLPDTITPEQLQGVYFLIDEDTAAMKVVKKKK